MIKVTGYSQKKAKYSIVYNKTTRVLNIESSSMCDDCTPYRESIGCMVWLDNDNTLGELECIFPVAVESTGSLISQNMRHINATPKFSISFEEKPIEVFFDRSQLLLIFNKNRKADGEYISSNIAFYVSDDELVAIVCTDYKLS